MRTWKISEEMKERISAQNEKKKEAESGALNKFGGKSVPVVAS